ncbi:hypothetical protein PR003_g12891 [Phytophthora rubi]|uniref:Crinkler effector protein N-terminal domain-containing protein n=1 Tax=Phytophthora rubi TaxID=129364 RepID=A0A6A4F6Z8_9STRA|nr:hypothetical protein PR002_g12420 [Phytophthora rubi]KAE9335680.1 hypothetical protein PR003_g12891 [Phytophthora rubi]
MVTLYCAVVGVAGSAFPVDIDETLCVGDLKDAIKDMKTYRFPAYELQLFLARKDKGRGAWLTEEEAMSGVGDTTNLELLESALSAIGDIGLSEEEVWLEVTKEAVEDLKGPVHVLVVVPSDPRVEGGTSAQDDSYYSCFEEFFSLLWPLDKIHSTKKDV